jgi:hypothetical protein
MVDSTHWKLVGEKEEEKGKDQDTTLTARLSLLISSSSELTLEFASDSRSLLHFSSLS